MFFRVGRGKRGIHLIFSCQCAVPGHCAALRSQYAPVSFNIDTKEMYSYYHVDEELAERAVVDLATLSATLKCASESGTNARASRGRVEEEEEEERGGVIATEGKVATENKYDGGWGGGTVPSETPDSSQAGITEYHVEGNTASWLRECRPAPGSGGRRSRELILPRISPHRIYQCLVEGVTRSKQPRGDNQPNDVYLHLQPRPFLQNDEDVYYPPTLIGFGLEHGQDPEERVYKVYSKKEVEDLRSKQLSKHGKHDKGGKGDHGKAIRSKPLPPPPSPHSPQQPSLPHPPPFLSTTSTTTAVKRGSPPLHLNTTALTPTLPLPHPSTTLSQPFPQRSLTAALTTTRSVAGVNTDTTRGTQYKIVAMPVKCTAGCGSNAVLKRPKTGDALCKECFFRAFEEEVHHTITAAKLFVPGDYVAIAASGGKDSTVLAYVMKLLNDRYNYGLKLVLLSVDEGITGYRDDSLETVKRNEQQYGIPLKVVSYEELYGWTMDRIVQQTGRRSNCTFCGVFRRQALDRGAALLGVDKIVTGHNADDIAETVLMNILRGRRGQTAEVYCHCYGFRGSHIKVQTFQRLDYFSTECIYSPNAYRGHARVFLKDLEKVRATSIIDVIHSGESFSVREGVKMPTQSTCERCGHVSSQAVCKACVLLEGLNKGKPRLGLGKSSKVEEHLASQSTDSSGTTQSPTKAPHAAQPSLSTTHSTQNALRSLHNLDF
ncbi:hypothetical protein O3P69_003885 [Scylla paramamosain]|uniref:Cytoplasmic tRNA adenylyltransferase 1 n=1 Tax=Scylla paramamosain TaxID=85552 RepID=A0AAW0UFB4_SCYPA